MNKQVKISKHMVIGVLCEIFNDNHRLEQFFEDDYSNLMDFLAGIKPGQMEFDLVDNDYENWTLQLMVLDKDMIIRYDFIPRKTGEYGYIKYE